MNIKIKNPKLLALLLANTVLLTSVGCENQNDYQNSEAIIKATYINNSDLEDELEIIDKEEVRKVNRNLCLREGKLSVKEAPEKESRIIRKISVYQKLKELSRTENGWSFVKYDGVKGYIRTKKIKKQCDNLGKTYIEIDISDQKMKYYENGKKVLSTDVVTGSQLKPTHVGLYDVYQKCPNYTMYGVNHDYQVTVSYAIKYNEIDLEYIHDADWRSEFGGDIYKTGGSHGCINTPYQKTKTLYEKVELHTPVLVHE